MTSSYQATTSTRAVTRYSAAMRWLHWLSALMMFIVIPVAWYMTELNRLHPNREAWFNFHKSVGITILLLTLIRIGARFVEPAPPLPASFPAFEKTLSHMGHGLLYVILLLMPLSGYFASYGSGHPIDWFWLVKLPSLIPLDKTLAHAGGFVHGMLAWLCYVLIAGHVLAVVYHQWGQHIDILGRMLGGARAKAD